MSSFTPFPETAWTAIRAVKSGDEAMRRLGWDVVSRLYWHAVQSYVRAKWRVSEQEASDAAQGFFTNIFERGTLTKYDPDKARFRTFLRLCLDSFLINEHNADRAKKRGQSVQESLESAGPDGGPLDPADPNSLEDIFEQEWRRSLFEAALADVESSSVTEIAKLQFSLFKRYDVEYESARSLTYDDLAREFGLSVATVTNHLHAIRGRVRAALLERLRSITASEEEFLEESRILLGKRRVNHK